MHLKSLILKGFKSFADRTALSLEPGVTVVVGPNGSGKSNISDGVLWVLGEQSAKALRGQAMEDVIFAGSSARQPVGVAEVDLVLDNSDGALPLEFTEVTVTRRMFRSGESEYLVNQSPCRLMDIHELLHDSGLGRGTHSIISQGQLDEILNSRPEDRRTLIEEAAGVLKHKKRRERALRKLTGMDAHLERARDVAREIDRQLRPLQKQADRAQEHSGILSDLRDIEISLGVDDLRMLRTEWDDLTKAEREKDAEHELLRYRLAEKERDLAKFQSLLEEKGLFVGDLSEQRRRLQSVLERINSGLLLLEEKGKNLVERLSELRQKLHQSETRASMRDEELTKLREERTTTDAQLKAHYASLSELRRETETSKKERMAADESLGSVNASIRRARKELEDGRAQLTTLDQTLAASQLESELLRERQVELAESRTALADTLAARRTRLDQLTSAQNHAKKERALAEAEVDKRVRVLETRRHDLTERRDGLGAARAEIRGLEEVDRAVATASPGVAWALAKGGEIPGLIGPLAEHISVVPALEPLVEKILGSDVFALLVSDQASAVALAEAISQQAEGDVSLIPVAQQESFTAPSNAPGSALVDSVSCEADLRPGIEALLGDVRLVDTLADALLASRTVPGPRYAAPDGSIVWPNGKITLGRGSSDAASVLARRRRINQLKDDVDALDAQVGESESIVSAAEEALNAAQQEALDLGQALAGFTGEYESLREELGRLEQNLTSFDRESERVDRRVQEIEERASREAPGRDECVKTIEAAETDLERLEEEAAVARERRDTRFREEAAINERLSQCQVDIATVSEREVHLKRQVNTITSELEELGRTVVSARETERALELLRDRVQPVHDLYSALLERAEHWAHKLRDRARFEQADSESLRTTIHDAQDAVRAAQTDVETHAGGMTDLRVLKGQLEVRVSQATAHIVEELAVPIERALDVPELEDRHAAEDRAHRLRKRIENLGPVNPIAMQEYESLRQRRDFLTTQVEDLAESRKALSKIIAAIDRKIRERFFETFEEVDTHFQNVFSVLFPGGHASLALTDPEDPENTGVEVIAQPLGKKLQKMSLLSGGEKSLTALALLFAVYRTRPCPFYILDEVEAALDDTNLRRFIAFVDSMRTHTQFIIVTHQRRTMEMADVLYGVSMQSDGVSKIVSQKLERKVKAESDDEHALV